MAEESTETVSDDSCMLCDDHDRKDDMVQCDVCDFWAHYGCAGVTSAVKKQPWTCPKCTNILQVHKEPKKLASKRPNTRKNSGKSDAGSEAGKATTLEESLEQLQQEKSAKEKAIEEEEILLEKRLEAEREIMEKMRLQQQRIREKKLAMEKEMLERQLSDEQEFLERQQYMRDRFKEMKLNLSQQFADSENFDEEDENGEEMATGGEDLPVQDSRGAFPKFSKQPLAPKQRNAEESRIEKPKFARPAKLNEPGSDQEKRKVNKQSQQQFPVPVGAQDGEFEGLLQEPNLTAEEEATIRNILARRRRNPPIPWAEDRPRNSWLLDRLYPSTFRSSEESRRFGRSS